MQDVLAHQMIFKEAFSFRQGRGNQSPVGDALGSGIPTEAFDVVRAWIFFISQVPSTDLLQPGTWFQGAGSARSTGETGEAWPPGTHGGTYGGNVVACAAALATLDVIEEEGLVDNARERGAQLLDGVRALQVRYPVIGDTRGLGLMVGLELVQPEVGDGREPNPAAVKAVLAGALQRGLMLLSAGPYGNVVRIVPPLVTTVAEVDQALGILDETFATL